MLKVIEYMAINSHGINDISDRVNEMLSRGIGWQPFGGINILDLNYYCQAMVRYEEVDHGSKV